MRTRTTLATVLALPLSLLSCDALFGLEGNPQLLGDGDGGVDPGDVCGDGERTGNEVCDDNNTADGDGCRGDCRGVEICGDDLEDFGEECDDGNMENGDGCRGNCTIEACGDGIKDPGEICVGVIQDLNFAVNGLDEVGPHHAVVADIDGDDDNDVVTTSAGINDQARVVSFREQSPGVYGSALVSAGADPLNSYPHDLLMIDLITEGTGLPDLYIAIRDAQGRIGFQENLGDGTFGSPVSVLCPDNGGLLGLAHGEFTGDPDQDLVALQGGTPKSTDGHLVLFEGDGTQGTGLGAASSTSVGFNPLDFAIGDFNGDTNLDAVVMAQQASMQGHELRPFFGNGLGTFTPQLPVSAGQGATYLASGDLDDDGDLDLVISDGAFQTVKLFRNNGTGIFTQETLPLADNFNGGPIAVADLDGDGDDDIAVVTYPGRIVTYRNDGGSGLFVSGVSELFYPEAETLAGSFFRLRAVELDGDAASELALSIAKDGMAQAGQVLLFDEDI